MTTILEFQLLSTFGVQNSLWRRNKVGKFHKLFLSLHHKFLESSNFVWEVGGRLLELVDDLLNFVQNLRTT